MPTIIYSDKGGGHIDKGIGNSALEGGSPTTHNGPNDLSFWQPSASGGHRPLIGVSDFSDIPAGAVITAAILTVKLITTGQMPAGATLALSKLIASGVVLAQTTYNEKATGSAWDLGGARGVGTDHASSTSFLCTLSGATAPGSTEVFNANAQGIADIQAMVGTSGQSLLWWGERTDSTANETELFGGLKQTTASSAELAVTYTIGSASNLMPTALAQRIRRRTGRRF